jgi:hypothetical protein
MAVIWAISELERETSNNGVTVAHWRASDEELVGVGDDAVNHYGSSYGSAGFTPDSTAEGFTPFADLTEAGVLVWVKASLGADMVAETEAAIAAQIADSKVPASAAGVPW